MADENDEKRLVRFDLPKGLDAAAIAQAAEARLSLVPVEAIP